MREQPTRGLTDVIVTNNNSWNPLILIRACQKLRGQYKMIFQIVILRVALDCVCITMKYLQRTCHVWINGDVIYWFVDSLCACFYLLSICNPLVIFIRFYFQFVMDSLVVFHSVTWMHKWSNTRILHPCNKVSGVYRPPVDSGLAPSQWEALLQSNAVSHWLGANLESALWTQHPCLSISLLVCPWSPMYALQRWILTWVFYFHMQYNLLLA